jgi:hypothetical protein
MRGSRIEGRAGGGGGEGTCVPKPKFGFRNSYNFRILSPRWVAQRGWQGGPTGAAATSLLRVLYDLQFANRPS